MSPLAVPCADAACGLATVAEAAAIESSSGTDKGGHEDGARIRAKTRADHGVAPWTEFIAI